MYTPRQSTLAFYEVVKSDYKKIASRKKDGVRIYSHEYIVSQLAKKHFRSSVTIENIIFDRVAHVREYYKKGA